MLNSVIQEINKKYSNDPVRERLCIAAVVCERMKEFANEVVMVGGSAVEFYTAASYMTKDIDFIAKDTVNIKRVMTELGFKNDGDGIWYHDDHYASVQEGTEAFGQCIGNHQRKSDRCESDPCIPSGSKGRRTFLQTK